MIEVTQFHKLGGPLTKRISLSADGKLISDGSACVMSAGYAYRQKFASLTAFSVCIDCLKSDQALALGVLRDELPELVQVFTKHRLQDPALDAKYYPIARTREYIDYRSGLPALVLIDVDVKKVPRCVRDRIEQLGGLLAAVKSVLPELATSGHVVRWSTSSCLKRSDTGEDIAGSDGLHIYVLVHDGSDIERFLRTLDARCWLLSLGWMMIGAGGQLLKRSLVDWTVFAPERLVFEGAPLLAKPLVQDREQRRAQVTEGPPLDTIAACPPLQITEKAKLDELYAMEAHRLAPERATARSQFIDERAKQLAVRTGASIETSRRTIERQIEGILLSDIQLPFDDEEFRGCTVDDVLDDPERFEGATLADPLEGVSYGRGKAKIMRRGDGSIWIHSFAHGRTIYDLKYGARKVEAILDATPDSEIVGVFVRLALNADLAKHDRERLRNLVHSRTGVNKRTIDEAVRGAEKEADVRREQEERNRRMAERRDPRPLIPVPTADAPWNPVMDTLNHVLGASTEAEPPARDIEGYVTQVRTRRPANMHLLTSCGSNSDETEETRLPAPEQPLLTRLDEAAVAELIERHIDFVDKGRPVHLPTSFVRHFVRRHDNALPIVTGVVTLPIVLPEGSILSGRGLNRNYELIFRVPRELIALLPSPADCMPRAVAEAMRFLVDEWLCDVATDYRGKCILLAILATIIERNILPSDLLFSSAPVSVAVAKQQQST